VAEATTDVDDGPRPREITMLDHGPRGVDARAHRLAELLELVGTMLPELPAELSLRLVLAGSERIGQSGEQLPPASADQLDESLDGSAGRVSGEAPARRDA
jgi:hypothetical protein